jgi:plastocyanin
MNTRKQVLIMTSLLLMMLITIGIYAAWYPSRATDSGVQFQDAEGERGAITFARNCRICHGNTGEGGALGARLPQAPALNRPDLQGFAPTQGKVTGGLDLTSTTLTVDDSTGIGAGDLLLVDKERLEVEAVNDTELTVKRAMDHTVAGQHFADAPVYRFDKTAFDPLNPNSTLNLIKNTITCGRVGTAMPAWGEANGGPLNDEQITQLATLITQGRWDLVSVEVNKEDKVPDATLLAPISADATEMQVSDVSVFTEGEALRIGDERVRVTSVPTLTTDQFGGLPSDRSGTIGIDRGVLGTAPLDHSQDTVLYRFAETPEPSINQKSCGQTAQAPAPAGTPELIEPFTGQTVEVTASNISFSMTDITVNSGGQVRIRLNNTDQATKHNIAFYKSSSDLTPVSDGSVGLQFEGPGTDDTVFDVPAPGTYYFRCDVHPTIMQGTFTVK